MNPTIAELLTDAAAMACVKRHGATDAEVRQTLARERRQGTSKHPHSITQIMLRAYRAARVGGAS